MDQARQSAQPIEKEIKLNVVIIVEIKSYAMSDGKPKQSRGGGCGHLGWLTNYWTIALTLLVRWCGVVWCTTYHDRTWKKWKQRTIFTQRTTRYSIIRITCRYIFQEKDRTERNINAIDSNCSALQMLRYLVDGVAAEGSLLYRHWLDPSETESEASVVWAEEGQRRCTCINPFVYWCSDLLQIETHNTCNHLIIEKISAINHFATALSVRHPSNAKNR